MVSSTHESTARAILYAFIANFGIAIEKSWAADQAVEGINALERELKARIPKLRWCFIEPDVVD